MPKFSPEEARQAAEAPPPNKPFLARDEALDLLIALSEKDSLTYFALRRLVAQEAWKWCHKALEGINPAMGDGEISRKALVGSASYQALMHLYAILDPARIKQEKSALVKPRLDRRR